VVDARGRLTGILTDADFRRLIVKTGGADILNQPVKQFVTPDPKHVHSGDLASEAMAIFNRYRIDELPVLDDDGRPVGIIDVQDVLGIKTMADGRD
jgi:arabinose-5-phosphate isomerase